MFKFKPKIKLDYKKLGVLMVATLVPGGLILIGAVALYRYQQKQNEEKKNETT